MPVDRVFAPADCRMGRRQRHLNQRRGSERRPHRTREFLPQGVVHGVF
jgi:hypothetical protein